MCIITSGHFLFRVNINGVPACEKVAACVCVRLHSNPAAFPSGAVSCTDFWKKLSLLFGKLYKLM